MLEQRKRREFEAPKRGSVLLLEDDHAMANFVEEVLSERHDVSWARSVEEAETLLRREHFDVALVDIRLDDRSTGLEFAARLRQDEKTSKVAIVMLTGSTEPADRERSLTLGADRYLLKPVSADTLRRVVNDLVAARDDLWWSVSLATDESERLRELLFDTTTDVPTLAVAVQSIRSTLEQSGSLHVYCLELEPLFRLDERDFWDAFDILRRHFSRGIQIIATGLLGNDTMVATNHPGGSEFYFFARPGRRSPAEVANDLESAARELLNRLEVDAMLADEVAVFVGGTVTQEQPIYAPRILYNAIREAKELAGRRENRYLRRLSRRLLHAIRDSEIVTVFQPVLELATGRVVGYEALSRGPAGSDIESAEVIFDLARDLQIVWDLESLCIRNVKELLPEICSRGSLFFNLESHFIQQLHHRGTDILKPLLDCSGRVVIEVTERSAIRDYATFRHTLHDLKQLGFRIAVDDCGSGYATLEAVAELQPDYLKVGHALFHNVERDPIRRQLVGLVARCADSIGAITIAEAIETEEQLRVCRELEIENGQGYIFARPGAWKEVRDLTFTSPPQ